MIIKCYIDIFSIVISLLAIIVFSFTFLNNGDLQFEIHNLGKKIDY